MEDLKRRAAARALEEVRDGMKLGLGTGSTAKHFVELLGERVRAGLEGGRRADLRGHPLRCARCGIPLTTLDQIDQLDLTVDGADEIDPALNLIKGGGGALLREKIVAAASDRMIVIADDTNGSTLGRFPLPVEVIPFGLAATRRAIEKAFGESGVSGRIAAHGGDGHVFVTDGGHWIVDAHLGRIADAPRLARLLSAIPGVVEHGLFIGLPARRCWRAPREFALLNGADAAIQENWNEELFQILSAAAGLAVGLACPSFRATPQAQAQPPSRRRRRRSRPPRKFWRSRTPARSTQTRCPASSQRTKDALLQSNLNYQKDLKEVAVIVAKKLAGREKEIGEGMAKIYASDFTEQELKDLVRSTSRRWARSCWRRAEGDPAQHGLHEPVGAEFRRKRQWGIPRRDAQARQGDLELADGTVLGRGGNG